MLMTKNAYQQYWSPESWIGRLCNESGVKEPPSQNQNYVNKRRPKPTLSEVPSATSWGPTHSLDSSDGEPKPKTSSPAPALTGLGNLMGVLASYTSKSDDKGSKQVSPDHPPSELNRSQGTDSTKSSHGSDSPSPSNGALATRTPSHTPTTRHPSYLQTVIHAFQCGNPNNSSDDVLDWCATPCAPRNLHTDYEESEDDVVAPLGISRLIGPSSIAKSTATAASSKKKQIPSSQESTTSSIKSTETPADRRRQRHKDRQLRSSSSSAIAPAASKSTSKSVNRSITKTESKSVTKSISSKPSLSIHDIPNTEGLETKPSSQAPTTAESRSAPKISDGKSSSTKPKSGSGSNMGTTRSANYKMPLESLMLDKASAVELERSISELTMRSSYGQATSKLAENRRMAYYAVGRHHRQSGRGGNRRCYFTGRLILSGAPFYAGSVQQGLRSLVVFCLPSSIGLPMETDQASVLQSINGSQASSKRFFNKRSNASVSSIRSRSRRQSNGHNSNNYLDDMSLSVEEELDPNWGMDKDKLLEILPDPSPSLLKEMSQRYPSQFETLPVQVRSPTCWRLYVKFCFFSGLPIAEGESHFKVRPEICDSYGEEIVLSHEVMEAVNGDSATILRLPNLQTFRYLRKHYNQQCGKLPEQVFQRKSWELVRPEI